MKITISKLLGTSGLFPASNNSESEPAPSNNNTAPQQNVDSSSEK